MIIETIKEHFHLPDINNNINSYSYLNFAKNIWLATSNLMVAYFGLQVTLWAPQIKRLNCFD